MGTIIGIFVLAFIAYLIQKNTGVSLPQWVAKKYQAHLDLKKSKKESNNSE